MPSTINSTPLDAIEPLILAIDVGSSSARALVYDGRGFAVTGLESHRPYRVHTDASGAVEVDPDALVALVSECIDEAVSDLATTNRSLAAVISCTFWHSLIGVDAEGKAVTPIYTWADTRSRQAVGELQRNLDEAVLHRTTGAVFHSSYWPAKIQWLRNVRPDLVRRVRFWMSFGEYFYSLLFNRRLVSVSMASGTGLFDQQACAWCSDLLDALQIREELLSPVADYTEVVTGLWGQFSQRWKALRDVPWFLALGDGACNNVGSGAYDGTRVAMMVGTSGAMRVVREVEHFDVPPELWTYRVDRKRIIQGGALSEGGNLFDWLVNRMQHPPIPNFEAELARMEPDGHGLTILPFFAGERSPHWRSDLRATFHGMTLDTSVADIVRAALEAIALRFALVYQSLLHQAPTSTAIIGTGAALLHSAVWMQIMSDALDHPLATCLVPEASSRGAALLALQAMNELVDLSRFEVPFGETYTPRRENARIYRSALKRQEDLYGRLSDFGASVDMDAAMGRRQKPSRPPGVGGV